MSVQTPVRENVVPPGSLEEYRALIASAFYAQHPDPQPGGGYAYVAGTYPDDGYIIVAVERMALPVRYFRYDFTVDGEAVEFGAAIPLALEFVPIEAVEAAARHRVELIANTPRHDLAEHAVAEARRDGTTLNLTVIRAGFNVGRGRYYTPEALQSGVAVFRGLKMYANHQTRTEERERPEGDVWQWVASLDEVAYDPATQSLRGTASIIDPAFRDKVALLDESGHLSDLGVSIRAIGAGEAAEVEGVPTFRVDEFVAGISVDFVTEAGAGGYVEFRESAEAVGVMSLTLASLREQRPDLVEALIQSHEQQHEEGDMPPTQEELDAMRTRAEQAEAARATAEAASAAAAAERDAATERAAAAESALQQAQATEALRTAQVEIGRLIAESGLPEPSQAHLRTTLAEQADVEAARAAIESHRQLVESLGVPVSRVRGNGAPAGGGEGAQTARSLEESFARIPGLGEQGAKLAAAGGR